MAPPKDIPPNLFNIGRPGPRIGQSRRWFAFNRSPLARKIILFNLIALGILVSGVLYLNQAQEAEVEYRSAVLAPQAEMIAAAIRSQGDNPAYDDLGSESFGILFRSLVAPSNSIVQIYDNAGQLKQGFVPQEPGKIGTDAESDAFTGLLQQVWAKISAPMGNMSAVDSQQNLRKQFANLAATAIASDARTNNAVLPVAGEIYIAVALPISGASGPNGAILISTRRGEVDAIIRRAREQILQIFLLATLSSIILSMVLANSIARPLRRLSAAAQNAQNEAGAKLNLARINIPDLTARPDEIGDLSRSMLNMTDALLDRIDENRSFAADVAHEIKNPLTSLRSAVETLEYVQDDASRSALLSVIKNDVERMDRLVTDISNASRLEADLVRDTWEAVNIAALLTGMAESFRQQNTVPETKIEVHIDTDNGEVRGLRSRLEQVFNNLVANALSFVPENGRVGIRVYDSGVDTVVIDVCDNGPGIPAENLEDIFSRFYSERPEAQFGEHSGLGLAISKQIVEAHGGTITARNTDKGGALFSVKLPR